MYTKYDSYILGIIITHNIMWQKIIFLFNWVSKKTVTKKIKIK